MYQRLTGDAEYEAALARAWELMQAEPGLPEEAELEALATEIERYEEIALLDEASTHHLMLRRAAEAQWQ